MLTFLEFQKLASIECHANDRQTLFHPFSLVGCQGCCKLSFLPSFSSKWRSLI